MILNSIAYLYIFSPIILALDLELINNRDSGQVPVLGDCDDGHRVKGQHHLVRYTVLLPNVRNRALNEGWLLELNIKANQFYFSMINKYLKNLVHNNTMMVYGKVWKNDGELG